MAIELDKAQLLSLHMIADIYEKLECDGVNPRFVREALHSGNFWALEWEYPGIFEVRAKPADIVKEVCDILSMYEVLERSGGEPFAGFDNSREYDHTSVARFLVENMDRFSSFQGRTGGGIMSLEPTRRMLLKFNEIYTDYTRDLTAEEVELIYNERVHPANRV